MNPDKSLLPCDQQALERLRRRLLTLADESSDLSRYHCLIVAASCHQDGLSPERQWSDAATLLSFYLHILDRERVESFVDELHEAQSQLRDILLEAEQLKRLI